MLKTMTVCGLLCVALACSALAAAPSEFIISFWCGPPPSETTLERYKEIADANFSVVLPPCGPTDVELNRKILDFCERFGMKAIIDDGRLLARQPSDPDFEANLDAVIADYASHPALFGYFLRDEPRVPQFPQLAPISQYLLKKDPKHVPYINLLPCASKPRTLGATNYEEYVKQFIEVVKPPLVSYDHYALIRGTEREIWWDNLEIVRRECLANDLPFIVIMLCVQHQGYRNPTEGDLRWQAYSSLAYGAKGILYFTYWTPFPPSKSSYRDAVITYDGKRTDHYDMVKRLNAEMSNLGRVLVKLKSTAVYHTSKIPSGASIRTADEELVIGEFADNKGRKYVMVMNRNPRKPREVEFTAVRAHKVVEVPKSGGRFVAIEDKFGSGVPVRLRFESGEGRLFRVVE